MTYCLGIKLNSGIVAISDTRITSGTLTTTAKKYKVYQTDSHKVFLMTSGLRSVRDKTLTYFSQHMKKKLNDFEQMYEVVNAFGNNLKQVANEDKSILQESGLEFNLFTIIGGQLPGDDEHKLYLVYPEGNWIEIGEGFPFTIIGNSGFGTPLLRRTINYSSSIRFALKTGFLSFDSTRVSANDVGYPIDVMVYKKNSNKIIVKRYEEKDLARVSKFWGTRLTEAIKDVPDSWMHQELIDD